MARKPRIPRPTEPSKNGSEPKKRRQRKPKKSPAEPAVPPPEPAPEPETPKQPPPLARPTGRGRLASSIRRTQTRWFLPGYIPYGSLVFVVGNFNTGKSTFGAWLCSQAKRPAVLPGGEQNVTGAFLDQMEANGVNLDDLLVLDDRRWALPSMRVALGQLLEEEKADLLLVDPVDSYIDEGSESDPHLIRSALEAFAGIAMVLDIAMVCSRHPGKAAGNLCPGSRHWGNVPRVILELRKEATFTGKRVLRVAKDGFGQCMAPREFRLEAPPKQPPRFVFADEVSEDFANSLLDPDPISQTMISEAEALLKEVLKDGRVEAKICYGLAKKEGLHERTVREARARLGIFPKREGSGIGHTSWWELPPKKDKQTDSGTPADPE